MPERSSGQPLFSDKNKIDTGMNSDHSIDTNLIPHFRYLPVELRGDLKAIEQTHILRPFTVFEFDGKAVPYLEIASKLRPGTLVEIEFNISHHYIMGIDHYNGIVNQILILKEAGTHLLSPFKQNAGKLCRPPAQSIEQLRKQKEALETMKRTYSSPAGPSSTLDPESPTPKPKKPKVVETQNAKDEAIGTKGAEETGKANGEATTE
ncbi:hypothetical protein C8F01DRAFT_1083106 [Mycena amicta]|nr:hypothetical protein C8F01DRAFT_1083106 [Mycena amicta]